MTVVDSTVSNNTSREGGGGIDADDDVDLSVTRSTFDNNATGPHGGGIELFDGTLTVTDSTISSNRLTDTSDFRSGGGIWTGLSVVDLTRSTVTGNSSPEYGGGIGFSGGPGSSMTLRDSTVEGNRATVSGGAIRSDAYYGDAVLVVDGSTIAGNTAGQSGGGVDAVGMHGFTSSLVVTGSTVAANVTAARGVGGGLDGYVDPSGGATSITVSSSRIGARPLHANDGNRAGFGAGIAANGDKGQASVELLPGASLVADTATYDGGGVFLRNGATLSTEPGVVWLLNSPDNVAG